MKRVGSKLTAALAWLLLAPIRAYRRWLSPALPPRCKYHPTCSAYAEQAIRELGPLRGAVVAGWRVVRCNPFSHGGYDPLEERSLFRERPRESQSQPHEPPEPVRADSRSEVRAA